MSTTLINVAYLVASILFILGLKGLTHPRSAVQGNLLGAAGMAIAAVVTLFAPEVTGDLTLVFAGLAVGAVLGAILAIRIEMTSMPQLVAIFNGFGGIASVLVAGAALYSAMGAGSGVLPESVKDALPAAATTQLLVATVASGLIGAVTFTGSIVAFAKLQEFRFMRKVNGFPGGQFVNAILFIASVGVSVVVATDPTQLEMYWVLVGVASVLGILLVVPIGGADMPVVIALLNSYSGIAASATGFVLQNNVLIIAGSLVGASGLILTQIMCKAMNRSLTNVLFAKLEPSAGGASADEVYAGKVKSTSAEEVAMLMDTAQRVVVVPGYGLAVAQAQHAVRDMTRILNDKGITVEFGIHPVAGRMPGHMNVLLAEADIPYESLLEMDVINPTFEQVDVTLVIGANDVVNPVARTDPESPIAGMPILDVDKSRTVIVVKRSLSPGFAGIPNPLFAADNTLMLFGDGKKALVELNQALKEG